MCCAYMTAYHSLSSVFMSNNVPSGMKSITKVLNQKLTKLFLFPSSS